MWPCRCASTPVIQMNATTASLSPMAWHYLEGKYPEAIRSARRCPGRFSGLCGNPPVPRGCAGAIRAPGGSGGGTTRLHDPGAGRVHGDGSQPAALHESGGPRPSAGRYSQGRVGQRLTAVFGCTDRAPLKRNMAAVTTLPPSRSGSRTTPRDTSLVARAPDRAATSHPVRPQNLWEMAAALPCPVNA